ncbi:MAG: tetratricopeptide repeat protein [Thermoanaerobaculia bacterium]
MSTPATPGDQKVVTSARQRLLLIAFGVALLAIGLALLEGLLAVLDVGDPQLYEDPFVGFSDSRDLFSEKRLADGRRVMATNPGKLQFFNHQQFAADKPANGYRIFALGGSTTAGRPYDSKVAFPHWMELYLRQMDPSRTWEVVNAGAVSYASYRVAVLIEELVRYQPDLFVIYTGHNEFLEERSYADTIHQDLALKKLRIWLNGFRFYTVARQRWLDLRGGEEAQVTVLPDAVAAKLDGWTGLELYHRDDELRRSIVEHFEYNLHQMIAIARGHGAKVVLVKPISNLADFSPFKSEHAASLAAADRARFATLLSEGLELLGGERPAEALSSLESARELDPEVAEVHFRIGRAQLALKDFDAARVSLVRAKDLDVAPLRALTAIEELVGEVAAEHGVPLVDLPAILEADSRERFGHGILGDEYLQDHVHPSLEVHSLIAERVLDVLVADGVVRRDPAGSDERRQAIYGGVLASMDPRYYARRDHNLGKVLAWAGKVEEAEAPLRRAAAALSDDPDVRRDLGTLLGRVGKHQEAVGELRRSIELDPESADAYFNLGTNLGHLGHLPEAVAALEQATRLRDDDPRAFFNLGTLYWQQGAMEKASAALARAAELRPGAGEIPRNQGLVYRAQGRDDLAIAAFEEALEIDPDDTVARTELGIVYGRQGRLEDASRELTAAVTADPSNAEAHYNLGVVYSQRRMPDDAVAAYEKAVELDSGRARAHNNLGVLYAGQGRPEDAREALTRALEIDPEYAEAYLNLGVVYDGAGRPDLALQVIAKALEIEPENGRLHYVLASLYQGLGDTERARVHFEQARARGFEPPG